MAGDHFGEWLTTDVYDEPVDERRVVHNHEHGAVSAWYDPDAVAGDELAALTGWAARRNEAGLANDAGAGVIVSPYPEALDAPAAVSFRSWSGGLDCETFDEVVADGFLLDHLGQAPEGNLAPGLDGIVERAALA